MDIMVEVEVNIDYPEYDVEQISNQKVYKTLNEVQRQLQQLQNSFEIGKIINIRR